MRDKGRLSHRLEVFLGAVDYPQVNLLRELRLHHPQRTHISYRDRARRHSLLLSSYMRVSKRHGEGRADIKGHAAVYHRYGRKRCRIWALRKGTSCLPDWSCIENSLQSPHGFFFFILTTQFRLAQTCDPPASASQELVLQACTTQLGQNVTFRMPIYFTHNKA